MSMITNIEERIAEEVRKYPHLYNTSLKDYKDARMTANSAAVELDTKDCDCFLFHSLYITIPPYLKPTWAPASDRVGARARQEQTAIKIFCPNNLWTYSFISYHETYPTASLESASTMMPSDRNSLSPYSSFLLNLLYDAFAACNHVVTARIQTNSRNRKKAVILNVKLFYSQKTPDSK